MTALILATFAFTGGHLVLSSGWVRDPLVARIGERPFIGVYAALMILAIVWLVGAYRTAPYIMLWNPPIGVRHITLSAMILASILAAGSFSRFNPAVAGMPAPRLEDGPRGMFRITRHPFNWAVALWAISHMLANGDAASLVFFGGFAALALLGTLHIDVRKRRLLGAPWAAYAAQSSHVPFAAILAKRTRLVWSEIGWTPVILGLILYVALLVLHEPVVGIAPLPQVSGIFP
jgi:uncharacterized membrane protein